MFIMPLTCPLASLDGSIILLQRIVRIKEHLYPCLHLDGLYHLIAEVLWHPNPPPALLSDECHDALPSIGHQHGITMHISKMGTL
ncbi:MAG: hypothetical protein K6A96_07840 [Prevotella sp.]|nr:hypothetical protein [Prevotella sp.]